MKIYRITLNARIDNNLQMKIMDLIPVKRKSDNKICMYDKISENFILNAGTGEFIAGPETDLSPKVNGNSYNIGEDENIEGNTVITVGEIQGNTLNI